MIEPDVPGICFAFSMMNTTFDDFDIKLYFSDQVREESSQSIPS